MDKNILSLCRSQPTALALIFLLLHRAQASCDRLSRRGSLIAAVSSPSPPFFRFFPLLPDAGGIASCGDVGDGCCCCCCSISSADEIDECWTTGTSACGGSMCVMACDVLDGNDDGRWWLEGGGECPRVRVR